MLKGGWGGGELLLHRESKIRIRQFYFGVNPVWGLLFVDTLEKD